MSASLVIAFTTGTRLRPMWWNSQSQHFSRRSCPGWRRPHTHRKAPPPIHAILHEEDCELFVRIRIRSRWALQEHLSHLLAELFLEVVEVVEFSVGRLGRHDQHTSRCLQLDGDRLRLFTTPPTTPNNSHRVHNRNSQTHLSTTQHPADWQSRVLSHVHEMY